MTDQDDELTLIRRRMREAMTLDEMLMWWQKGIDLLRASGQSARDEK